MQRWQRQQKNREMAERDGRQRQGEMAETGTERWQRDRRDKKMVERDKNETTETNGREIETVRNSHSISSPCVSPFQEREHTEV